MSGKAHLKDVLILNSSLGIAMYVATNNVPNWKISGGWFMFASIAYHALASSPKLRLMATVIVYSYGISIQKGQYGETTSLDGLNVLGIGSFTGNIWAGNTK